ncbi:MAG: methionine gamma-lyase family protein [Firmicutes bacterium]|nr:methionine gamma-lyase family protein [Bacillota bacterium]
MHKLILEAQEALALQFAELDKIAYHNQKKVLEAFIDNKVSASHFVQTTGYGYGDRGREVLNNVFAQSLGAKGLSLKAIVSSSLASGTHALAVALFGMLRPGDIMLSVSGKPYDTLEKVIGLDKGLKQGGKQGGEAACGSLKEYGVGYKQIDLIGGCLNIKQIIKEIKGKSASKIKLLYLQRSRGYEWRDSISIAQIGELTKALKQNNISLPLMVDNCYGEFTNIKEPTDVGADIIVGSLIKNAGGGLVATGGYIVGKEKWVNKIANRLTAPGLALEVGSNAAGYQYLFQGLFIASHTTVQALKGNLLLGYVLESLGFETHPSVKKDFDPTKDFDFIRSVKFDTPNRLIDFCQLVQHVSPVDAYVTPESFAMPGYPNDVIMAGGTFVQGATSELSADAPIRPPYIAYIQGGLTYQHILYLAEKIIEKFAKGSKV